MHQGTRNVLKKIFKVLGWIIGSIVLFLVLIALLIQIPAVQRTLTDKAVVFLEEKIGTEVSLGGNQHQLSKKHCVGRYLPGGSGR